LYIRIERIKIMKPLIAFVLGLSLFVSASHAQTQQAPTNQQGSRNQPQSNSGWQQVNIGATQDLHSICFINPDTGWIAGADGLFRTTDSGNTWLPWGPAGSYQKVQFLNSKIGWVMPQIGSGQIIHTIDGGMNWINESTGYSPQEFIFLNRDTGIACRGGDESRTVDGGGHWVDSANNAYSGLYKILAFDQSHLLMVGGATVWQNQPPYTPYSDFLYSSNAGLTWNRMKFDSAHSQLITGSVVNSTQAFVAGDTLIGYTSNGGQSWTFSNQPYTVLFGSCAAPNDVWYLSGGKTSGASVILESTDEGKNWVSQNCPDIGGLTAIVFPTPLSGWAVSGSAGVLHTTTGGFASVGQFPQPRQNLPIEIFPNPSQKQVQLQYVLPKAESVTLQVYNTTGQLFTTPLNNALQNPGIQQIRLPTGTLTAGDYVFLLSSQDYLQSGRFAVIK
jgi:photosystem II stability/assembly factor-like uncharacterized protein